MLDFSVNPITLLQLTASLHSDLPPSNQQPFERPKQSIVVLQKGGTFSVNFGNIPGILETFQKRNSCRNVPPLCNPNQQLSLCVEKTTKKTICIKIYDEVGLIKLIYFGNDVSMCCSDWSCVVFKLNSQNCVYMPDECHGTETM